jgi:hypothetical protein
MKIKYQELGVCGLSCRLCPRYNTDAKSRCPGCKSKWRMAAGCPFITCAVKKKGIEFCWECVENKTCEKWKKHRAAGAKADSFKCYQKLNEDIVYIQEKGVPEFEKKQKIREKLLKKMLRDFDEGRSKSYYCIAVTVFAPEEIRSVLATADKAQGRMEIKEKSKMLHALLDKAAANKNYCLKLRK